MVAEPVGEPARIRIKDEPGDLGRADTVGNGRLSGELCLRSPFDEKRMRRLGDSLINPGAPPSHLVSAKRRPRPSVNR